MRTAASLGERAPLLSLSKRGAKTAAWASVKSGLPDSACLRGRLIRNSPESSPQTTASRQPGGRGSPAPPPLKGLDRNLPWPRQDPARVSRPAWEGQGTVCGGVWATPRAPPVGLQASRSRGAREPVVCTAGPGMSPALSRPYEPHAPPQSRHTAWKTSLPPYTCVHTCVHTATPPPGQGHPDKCSEQVCQSQSGGR